MWTPHGACSYNTRCCSFEPYSTIWSLDSGVWKMDCNMESTKHASISVSLHQPFCMKLDEADVSFCSVLHRWIYFSLLTSRKTFLNLNKIMNVSITLLIWSWKIKFILCCTTAVVQVLVHSPQLTLFTSLQNVPSRSFRSRTSWRVMRTKTHKV